MSITANLTREEILNAFSYSVEEMAFNVVDLCEENLDRTIFDHSAQIEFEIRQDPVVKGKIFLMCEEGFSETLLENLTVPGLKFNSSSDLLCELLNIFAGVLLVQLNWKPYWLDFPRCESAKSLKWPESEAKISVSLKDVENRKIKIGIFV